MPSSLLLTLPHLAKESLALCRPDRLYFLCVLCSSLSLAPVVPWQGGSLHPRLPRAQAEGEIPNTQGWRGRFQTGDRTVKKGLSQTVALSQVRRARSSGKVPARESALSLKHGRANPVSGFACADGVAGFTSTALILIPLPTVLPVWTLLRNCGHCLKRTAAELGSQGSV